MKQLLLTPNGQIPPKVKSNFGGEFSFFEKIKMGGVGSPKIIFQANDSQLDDLQLFEDLLIYANLELLKEGFVLRLWQHRAFRAIVFGLEETTHIEFHRYPIRANKPNIYAGDLFFYTPHGNLTLFIPPNSFRKMASFLQKSHFNNLTITEKPEKLPEDLTVTGINILTFLKN